MGTFLEINDTLQISKEQGFPGELDINKHLKTPYKVDGFKDKTFKFSNKPGIRYYHQPPVRVFLVENVDNKWIYWGLVHLESVTYDYINKTTSGEYKIISLYSPEEMKKAQDLIDGRPEFYYFN